MASINVLIAIESGKVKECIVIPPDENNVEFGLRNVMYEIYGAQNVCSSSREIGYIPSNIARFLAEKSIGVRRKDWIPFPAGDPGDLLPYINTRYLVKLANGWVTCASYFYNNVNNRVDTIWKDDKGEELISVCYWKHLDK